ncbi:MAG TPA: hypothetical protein VJR03_01050 [Nitrospira sp.]|nr:hypothetical protein [Nitrospira sp.]
MSMRIAGVCVSTVLGIVVTIGSLFPRHAAAEDSTWMNECCTPEATAKMAGLAGVVDIVGIKVGMTGDQAMAALKAANPKFKIDVVRTQTRWDYAARLTDDSRADPTKLWVLGVHASAPFIRNYSPETVTVGFSTHPNQPFVYMVSRMVVFQEGSMPTAENVLAGLRKKYGPESYPVPASTGEGFPDLRWVFDVKGQLIGGPLGQAVATSCGTRTDGIEAPDISGLSSNLKKQGTTLMNQGSFVYPGDPKKHLHCEDWILLRVVLGKTIMTSPLVSQMNATLWHVPLYVSGLNATYSWVDQARQGQADKKLKEAEKVDMPKF